MQAVVPAHPYAAGLIIAMVSSFLSMGKSKRSAPRDVKVPTPSARTQARTMAPKANPVQPKGINPDPNLCEGHRGDAGEGKQSTQEVDRVSSPSCRAPVAFFLLAAALVCGRPEYTQPTGQEMIP